MNAIKVDIKNKYGNTLVYPVCDKAKIFCELLGGQKTLTESNIKHIKKLGFEVNVIQGVTTL